MQKSLLQKLNFNSFFCTLFLILFLLVVAPLASQAATTPMIVSVIAGIDDSGMASHDTGLIITGENLLGASGVNFYNTNDVLLAKISNPDSNSYMGKGVVVSGDGKQVQVIYGALKSVVFPASTQLGALKISVVTPGGVSNLIPLTLLGTPAISALTPSTFVADSNANLTIEGINFWGDGGSTVEFYQNGQKFLAITPLVARTRVLTGSIFLDASQDGLFPKLPVGSYQVQVVNNLNGVISKSNFMNLSVIKNLPVACPSGFVLKSESTCVPIPPAITVTAPVSNSTWEIGSTKTFTWKTERASDKNSVTIVLNPDNVSTYKGGLAYLAFNIPNTGSFLWKVGSTVKDPYTTGSIPLPVPAGKYMPIVYLNNDVEHGSGPIAHFTIGGLLPYSEQGSSNVAGGLNLVDTCPTADCTIGTPTSTQNPNQTTVQTPTTPTPTNPALPVTPAPSTIATQIALLRAQIAAMQGTPTPSTGTIPSSASTCTTLTKNLSYKSTDAKTEGQVTLLQKYLAGDGYLATAPTGYFGSATLKATKAFQRTEGINPTGYVGPQTRAKIQALSCE